MKEERDQEQKKVTRKDIANLAGVSVSVVSRALNNSGYVKKEVKEQILQIAKELHYIPNPVAMSLQQSRTRQILFYCKDLHNAFNIDLYNGMLREAKRRNYMVLLNGNLNFRKIRETMIDGIILQNEFWAVEFDQICGKNYYLPAVIAGFGCRYHLNRSIPVVEWDLYQGMTMAIEYLWKKGHRQIAFATPYRFDSSDTRTVSWIQNMGTYAKDQVAEHYLGVGDCDPPFEDRMPQFRTEQEAANVESEDAFFHDGLLAARQLLEKKLKVTAVICFNDELAYGMMQELQRNGYRIPEDFSLISFDGSYRRRYVFPELTSISNRPEYHGELLAKTLIDVIEEKPFHYVTRIPSVLLEGGTVRDFTRN